MVRVISRLRQETDSVKAKILNATLDPRLIKAWNDVTTPTIRNCFAHVPTIPKAAKNLLRQQDDLLSTKDGTLCNFYPDRAGAIKKQNDIGALAYIESCLGKGPTKRLTDAIGAAAASEEWGDRFMPADRKRCYFGLRLFPWQRCQRC
ncbi:hypothetical protein EDD21DRAFT_356370 [Dissophora ornata]|nr:hypothetical protein EDD21DRAFT_356370 [Dissophora ornata]